MSTSTRFGPNADAEIPQLRSKLTLAVGATATQFLTASDPDTLSRRGKFEVGLDRPPVLIMNRRVAPSKDEPYDEDTNGAFFQLYSQPFAGGMFFEIVQRKDGYAGYGAPNAPFRIAAQKRLMRPKGMPKN